VVRIIETEVKGKILMAVTGGAESEGKLHPRDEDQQLAC
jgi:hypothetical protein